MEKISTGAVEMKKHKFNIFPDASEEDYGRLVSDIRQHGYDETLPIVLYQGAILDGWSRYRACAEIGIEPVSIQFDGDDVVIPYQFRSVSIG